MKINGVLYFDHQATTPVDSKVFEVMRPYFEVEFGNPHSTEHCIGWAADRAIEEAKGKISKYLDVDNDEIYFTSGATEANNIAICGHRKPKHGDRNKIIYCSTEHKSVIEPILHLAGLGKCNAVCVNVDSNGVVKLDELERHADEKTSILSIMAVNNEIGTIQPIKEIGAIAKKHGIHFHCDATQAPCAIDLNRYICDIDSLSLSGHKIYGPKGVGILYLARHAQDNVEPIFFGGAQQGRLRPGTLPTPLCVGMGAALEVIASDTENAERKRVSYLRNYLVKQIRNNDIPININGPTYEIRHPGNVNIRFDGYSAHDILATLQPMLAASTGSACTSGTIGSSYVLRSIGLTEEEANSSIRFCVGRYTSEDHIRELVDLLVKYVHG